MPNDGSTEIGGSAGEFPATAWTLLKNVRTQSAESRAKALQPLLELYWKPVYCLIRQAWKKSNEEAKDLTQDFFMRMVLEGGLLEKYAPDRGGFRPFLKASVLNFLRDDAKIAGAQKRGGGASHLRFPVETEDPLLEIPDAETLAPDQIFDAAWRQTILGRAVDLVGRRLKAAGKAKALDVFRRYDLEGESDISYEKLADEMKMSRDAVKDALKLARAEFRSAVLDVVAEGVGSSEDLYREVDELLG